MSKRVLIQRDLRLANSQVRELEDGRRTIEGFIPYNSRSEYMGFFEYIMPTAFEKTLKDGADVRCLMNHDSNKLLGRVKNGSLRLSSAEDGLHIECDLPQTSYAEDVYNLIRDEYNTGLSFGFYIIKEDYGEEDGEEVHYLREVKLLEVSFAVSFPAYEGTGSKARSIRSILEELQDLPKEDLVEIKKKVEELLPEEKEDPASEPDEPAAESTEEDEDEEQIDKLLEEIEALKSSK